VRGCSRQQKFANLTSLSVNVHHGAVGYQDAYYSGIGDNNIDQIQWSLLELEGNSIGTGLDGVSWPELAYMQGFAVGEGGTIVKIDNGGVTNWDPFDLEVTQIDPRQIYDVVPENADKSGCVTQRHIRDVFFWNNHLAFFVGDLGYLCRRAPRCRRPLCRMDARGCANAQSGRSMPRKMPRIVTGTRSA
jgi:hypothetical protein